MGDAVSGSEVGDLLGALIRNRCVSNMVDGASVGDESVNAAVLRSVIEGPGLDVEWYEPIEGRASLVARIEGTDPGAPSLALMGHTDVVPADADDGWTHDPFGGELVDGEIWGRGAVDMLNQTAAMALAMRRLADDGFRPKGDLVFWAVPDEECGGVQGAMTTLSNDHDLVRTDYALTEVGGTVRREGNALVVDASVADKGLLPCHITVRGRQAHASLPYGAANPVVTAAEVIRRLNEWQPAIRVHETWQRWVLAQGFDADLAAALVDPRRLDDAIELLPPDLAAHAHACTRCTVVPTVVQGGDKLNTIPQTVTVQVNLRPTIGDDVDQIIDDIQGLLADLVDPADVIMLGANATLSPSATPLWDVLADVTSSVHHGAELVPAMLAAWTDASWLRGAGTITYGFGLLSESLTRGEYWSRFHGVDERIDLESLELSALGWHQVARRFLS
jgi:acetylornithine deacetylase/succinyl-diaminopimelate desuccinylase-like protein